MPHAIEKTVFAFDELSESAKDRVRQRFSERIGPEDFESTVSDFVTVVGLMGFEVSGRSWTNSYGHDGTTPDVHWSGLYTQGVGVYFYGTYAYAKGARKAVREYAPQDVKLHAIVDELQALQRPHFYRLTAKLRRGYRDGSVAEVYTTDADGYDADVSDETERAFKDVVYALEQWLFWRLRDQDEHLTSEENVAEAMDGVWFDEDGDEEDAPE